ncbi:MAG TPA: hypothetical protein PKD53_26920 [Chloroflexaceae bacterium]|nr:hypothetical protein [Chloroflexaceae bacterium]
MGVIFQIHSIFGERILPLLLVIAAIYLTVTYKPDAPRSPVARIFPILVDIQVTLGLIYWIFLLLTTSGETQARYLGFPFILHPLIGFLAAGLAHMAVGPRNPLRGLGRWAPLASIGVLTVLVVSNVVIGIQA